MVLDTCLCRAYSFYSHEGGAAPTHKKALLIISTTKLYQLLLSRVPKLSALASSVADARNFGGLLTFKPTAARPPCPYKKV